MTFTSPPRWPLGLDALGFGGDYNPEQWSTDVQVQDVALMREAGVNLVSLGVFSWATIEPVEGELHWTWLDEAMDRLQAAGIRVDLATATASPPPWLTARHPEILPVKADGTVLWPGARQRYRIASPVWRRYAVGMARRVAERYADHPAWSMWHVDNELGCHVPHDFSDDAGTTGKKITERVLEGLPHQPDPRGRPPGPDPASLGRAAPGLLHHRPVLQRRHRSDSTESSSSTDASPAATETATTTDNACSWSLARYSSHRNSDEPLGARE